MDTVTVRSSTVYIAQGDQLDVYRSLEEVPPALRRVLDESTSSSNSATILIADRNGQRELVRAIEGQPTPLRMRVKTSRSAEAQKEPATEPEGPQRPWVEMSLVGLLGLVAWLVFLWK